LKKILHREQAACLGYVLTVTAQNGICRWRLPIRLALLCGLRSNASFHREIKLQKSSSPTDLGYVAKFEAL